MRHIISLRPLSVSLVFVFIVVCPSVAASAQSTISVPVLTVSIDGGQSTGALSTLDLEVVIGRGSGPLTVGVSEDRVQGIGDSLRRSVWIAALAVALDRGDPLAGTRVHATVRGHVDGPSAGATLAIAIMSALDGKKLPDDFACTGTIAPDGTIGSVGGVGHKVLAAKRAGKKRVLVPAFIRKVENPSGEGTVDIRQLCRQLGITHVPVRTLHEAYEIVHRLPARAQPHELMTTRFPASWEEAFRSTAQAMAKEAAIQQKMNERSHYHATRDKLIQKMTNDAKEQSEAAAAQQNDVSHFLHAMQWLAIAKAVPLADEFRARGFRQYETWSVQDAAQKHVVTIFTEYTASLAKQLDAMTPAQQTHLGSWLGALPIYRMYADSFLSQGGLNSELQGVFIAYLGRTQGEELLERFRQFPWLDVPCVTPKHRNRLVAVESLYSNALTAADDVFTYEFVIPHSVANDQEFEVAMSQVLGLDNLAAQARLMVRVSRLLTQSITDPGNTFNPTEVAIATQIYSQGMAQVLAANVRWMELEATPDLKPYAFGVEFRDPNVPFKYGQPQALDHMIREARQNAIRAIADCRKDGILPVMALISFHEADAMRLRERQDGVNLLASYWDAFLNARALGMIYLK